MQAFWDNGVCRLIQADARHIPLPDESVQCVVTSPPYWGLRLYSGLQPLVWGGAPGCDHSWGEPVVVADSHFDLGTSTLSGPNATQMGEGTFRSESAFCLRCPGWRGHLGLEPNPDLYVQHVVECFREVRRVLRSDGVCWLNLGDSYAGSGIHSSHHANPGLSRAAERGGDVATPTPPGLKPKDLVGIPWRVALALQADGWWLRSDCIWDKPNPMPESVRDRPTRSHEYVFLLTKTADYYYDAEAVREPSTERASGNKTRRMNTHGRLNTHLGFGIPYEPNATGRNAHSVWHIATQPSGYEMCQACGKVYTGAQYHRLPKATYQAFDVETEELEDHESKRCNRCKAVDAWLSHFATFPEALVGPCILAGTSEKGCCPECGAPRERVTEPAAAAMPESWHQRREDCAGTGSR